jgi:hypothetical protein
MGVQDRGCHLCYLGLIDVPLYLIQSNWTSFGRGGGVCRNGLLETWPWRKNDLNLIFFINSLRCCTIPMTNVWHFFGKYLFSYLFIYKTRLSNPKLNFWEFQQLKNNSTKYTFCCLFVVITQCLGQYFFFTNWEFYSQKYQPISIKKIPSFGQIFCVEHES